MDKKYLAKIIATDNDGLQMISACCSGAKVKISDIKFLKSNKIFLLSIERTKIESGEEYKKVNSICKFDFVDRVKSKNINQKNKNKPLEYMAIKSNILSNNNFQIKIFFSGGGVITVVSEIVKVLINDLGKPWKVKYFPLHKI